MQFSYLKSEMTQLRNSTKGYNMGADSAQKQLHTCIVDISEFESHFCTGPDCPANIFDCWKQMMAEKVSVKIQSGYAGEICEAIENADKILSVAEGEATEKIKYAYFTGDPNELINAAAFKNMKVEDLKKFSPELYEKVLRGDLTFTDAVAALVQHNETEFSVDEKRDIFIDLKEKTGNALTSEGLNYEFFDEDAVRFTVDDYMNMTPSNLEAIAPELYAHVKSGDMTFDDALIALALKDTSNNDGMGVTREMGTLTAALSARDQGVTGAGFTYEQNGGTFGGSVDGGFSYGNVRRCAAAAGNIQWDEGETFDAHVGIKAHTDSHIVAGYDLTGYDYRGKPWQELSQDKIDRMNSLCVGESLPTNSEHLNNLVLEFDALYCTDDMSPAEKAYMGYKYIMANSEYSHCYADDVGPGYESGIMERMGASCNSDYASGVVRGTSVLDQTGLGACENHASACAAIFRMYGFDARVEGTSGGGHFYCVVRDPNNGDKYYFDCDEHGLPKNSSCDAHGDDYASFFCSSANEVPYSYSHGSETKEASEGYNGCVNYNAFLRDPKTDQFYNYWEHKSDESA